MKMTECIDTGCKREGLQQLLAEKSRQIETLLRGINDARCLMDPDGLADRRMTWATA